MITIKIDDSQLRAALSRVKNAMKNPRRLFKAIGTALVSSTEDRFRYGLDPEGISWAPVKRGGQPLVPTQRRLSRSINYIAGDDYVEVGTNVPYAQYCQFGTKPHEIKPKNKKALFWKGADHPVKKVDHPGTDPRPFLGISKDDGEEILALIEDFITAAWNGE